MKKRYYKSRLPEYDFGDWLKEKALPTAGDFMKRSTDNILSVVGAGNVINEDNYKTDTFKKLDKSMDKVFGIGGQVAANIVAPGVGGAALGAVQGGVSSATGDLVQDRKDQEASELLKREQYIKSANQNLKINNPSNIPTFELGGIVHQGASSKVGDRTIKGSIVAELQNRHNSTRNKKQKKHYVDMLYHLNQLDTKGLHGREEFEFYKSDPKLNHLLVDPVTKGTFQKRGIKALDIEYPQGFDTKELQSFQKGGYLIDYKGNSHKEDGIPVDAVTGKPVPRMLADGEVEDKEFGVKFPGEENPYIFSHKLGFADKARKITKKYSKRKNDSITKNTMFMELGGLLDEQEGIREQNVNNIMEDFNEEGAYKYGGKLKLRTYEEPNKGNGFSNFLNPELSLDTDSQFAYDTSIKGNPLFLKPYDISSHDTDNFTPYRGSYLPVASNIAGNITGLMRANKAGKNMTYNDVPDYNPETIDLSDARSMIKERGRSRFSHLRASIKNLSPQQQAAVLSSYSDADENSAIRESFLNERSINADTRNRAKMFNIEKNLLTSQEKRDREEAIRQEKQAYINNMFNAVSSAVTQGQKYDVLNMMSDNYMVGQDADANLWQKFAGTKPKYYTKRT